MSRCCKVPDYARLSEPVRLGVNNCFCVNKKTNNTFRLKIKQLLICNEICNES